MRESGGIIQPIVERASLARPREKVCLRRWHGPLALSRRPWAAQHERMSEDVLSLATRAIEAVGPVIGSVEVSDLGRSTPCADFDVGTLVAHLIGGLRALADVGEGKPFRFDADPDVTKEPASDAYRKAADRFVSAFRQPGVLERDFKMPWGYTTGRQLVGFELLEVVVHGWDISRSLTARPVRFDDDLVEATLTSARQWVDDSVRTPQMFGLEVSAPPDAPAIDRLVAFLGRHPDWPGAQAQA